MDWQQWLARAIATGDLRATLVQAELEARDDRKVAILKSVLDRPLCSEKEQVQAALAMRSLPQFKQDYVNLFERVMAAPMRDPTTQYQVARYLLNERPAEKPRAIELMKSAAEEFTLRHLGRNSKLKTPGRS